MQPSDPHDPDGDPSSGDSLEAVSSDPGSDSDRAVEVMLREVAHAPPQQPRSALIQGARWGGSERYIIERRLGRGGMGTVYAATDTILGRSVAIKVLDAVAPGHDASHDARLLREAQLAACVEHERVARVYDAGKHDGYTYLAMEYIAGRTLRQRMTAGTVPLPEAIDIATQIAEGLAALHARGVVHRDLMPENVMLTVEGGVKLLDFGLARNAVLSAAPPGTPAATAAVDGASLAASGTPGYMAPEQYAQRPIDTRADVFSLGVILYELIAGHRLFRGATVETIIRATLADAPVFVDATWAQIPEQVRAHTARMLARDPAARFPDGAGALAALRELAASAPSGGAPLPAATAALGKLRGPGGAAAVLSRVSSALARGAEPVFVVAALALLMLPDALYRTPHPPPPGMVRVPAGKLDVGHAPAELDDECRAVGPRCDRAVRQREVPRTQVTVAPFFLDREEVTNAAYAALLNDFASELVVLDDEDYHYPRFVRRNAGTGSGEVLIDLNAKHGGIEYVDRRMFRARPDRERWPAAQVSWYGAKLFCETRGKRLPTEDEWEAAARGPEDRHFPWGDDPPRCGAVVLTNDGDVAMAGDCPVHVVERAVGTSPQDETPDGVRDLAGNVAEWTSSWFIENDRAARPATALPDAPRVIRGGSWGASFMARTSGRAGRAPSIMGANLGFRCAVDAEREDSKL